MKATTKEKLKLGIFVIIGLLLFITAVYFIGQKQNMFGKKVSISANFNNVNGLRLGNNVRYSGIKVGTVKAITMVNDTTISVDMNIEEKMISHIKKDAIATIGTDGLVGNMIVNIIPGSQSETVVNSGDVIKSYSKIGADDMLNTLSVTNENAAILTADLLKVTQSLTQGRGTFGRLLNDTIIANELQRTITSLKEASYKANTSFEELNNLMKSIDLQNSTAGILLSDTISGTKMKNVISNLEISSAQIDTITKSIHQFVNDIQAGEGTLNYLVTDTAFVKQLERTMKNIETGTHKFDANMEALKHNFLTRSYFRKIERQQKREDKKSK
jgi:phospholipid/cholesterol/gamma-HCH transport system substrate-binding protein